ncbi:MAG: hypothetical protein LBG47_00470 [Prevotellaceae bacterium]|jgi:hypothetical protein|nr:hypothetical protein [Prevotellaceae bacterium]
MNTLKGYTALGIVLCKNSAQITQIFMIYADKEKAKIWANHKNLRHPCAKKTNRIKRLEIA